MKLKCKDHRKRVWVNPITKAVLHRSSNADNSDLHCGSKLVGYGDSTIAVESAMTPAHIAVNANCMHCGRPAPTNWRWADGPLPDLYLCRKRQGRQEHVYG